MQANYTIAGIKNFVRLAIWKLEFDLKPKNDDSRCKYKISVPNYRKNFHVYGINEI